jgi:SAM-dependent methyltransferase
MKIPSALRPVVLQFECAIEAAVEEFAIRLDPGVRLLDAGAGECQYRRWFLRQRYTAVDLAVGDASWKYADLDVVCDLTALPFADGCFDAVINIVTLEHLPEPAAALSEIARMLRPNGKLLLVVPFEWEVHQEPIDYFRFTRYGLDYLLRGAGFDQIGIRPVGGYFRLLSRRLFSGIQFFTGGWLWILFPFAVAVLGPLALIAPLFEPIDRKKAFTSGYIALARRRC